MKESNNLFDNLHEAIEKMKLHTLSDRFEVVLNNNLIESKEKLTNFRTILSCRISYDNLDKNISFIVREDNKPSYEELEQENKRLKIQVSAREEVANKYKKIIDETRKFIEDWLFDAGGNGASMTYEDINELLQILDKGE